MPDEYSHHEGSFSTYFRNKQIKLQNQVQHITPESSIFKDVVVFINGHTNPSAPNLKRMIVANGGEVCSFLQNKQSCTHIVASNITSRKTINFKEYKVVQPEWITESISKGKLLNWTNYRTRMEVALNKHFKPDTIEQIDDESGPEELGQEEPEPAPPKADLTTEESQIQWINEQRKRYNCLEPNFVHDYFAKSRLHFMSMRKLALRRKCRQYKPPQFSKPSDLARKIMHVDFDAFFVSVALKSRPDLKDKPVCVSFGSDSSDVASCNYIARKMGVRNGMWIKQTKSICPDLVCLPYDFEEYERCSDILYKTLMDIQPLYIAAVSADEAIIDISNLTGPIDMLCANVRQRIRQQTGIEASVGIGSNILLAKLALKRAKPAGMCVLTASELDEFSVRDLPGVGSQMMAKLDLLKVSTIKDLKIVPVNILNQRIGLTMGRKLFGYARGEDSSDLSILDTPVRTVGMDIGWGVRLLNDNEKDILFRNCCAELHHRLELAGLDNSVFTVKVYKREANAPFVPSKPLGHGSCDIINKSKRVNAQISVDELFEECKLLYTQIKCPPLDFRGLGLHMSVLEHQDKPKQITFNESLKRMQQAPKTPEKNKQRSMPLVALKPRKKRPKNTLTQIFDASSQSQNHADRQLVDLSVLKDLPSQIRREILLNEDDYLVPSQEPKRIPVFKMTSLLDKQTITEKFDLISEWMCENEPVREDVMLVYDYIHEAILTDSQYVHTMQLVEWINTLARGRESWVKCAEIYQNLVHKTLLDRIQD